MEDARMSTRLLERRKRQVEEKERKAEKERKRAKTMFQQKRKVIGPHDLLVNTRTGKIHLGSEEAPEDVKVKVEPKDSEELMASSGSTDAQGKMFVTHEDIQRKNATSCPANDSNENEDGLSTSGAQTPLNPASAENLSLAAVIGQLNEMKDRLKEQDQKNVQLTAELEAVKAEVVSVKEKGEAKINELQETIAQIQLQLSATKDVPKATAGKEGLVSTNNQLQGQVSQGHFLAQNDWDLQRKPDQDGSPKDMAMLSPGCNDNCGTAVEHPDDVESLPEEKSRHERIDPPVFEAVLNILVERGRTFTGKINWSSVCGVMKKCRLVCQSWKTSVDSVLQTHPSHLKLYKPVPFASIKSDEFSPCPLNLSFVGNPSDAQMPLDIVPSKMGQFVMNLPLANAGSNYNPVPTRHLNVRFPRFPLNTKSREPTGNVYHLTDYLRVFGHQIWYLRLSWGITYDVAARDFYDVCHSVLEILHLVPNLRLLSLVVSVAKHIHLSESEMEYQFSHLKHLVAVECLEENPVIVQILKANSHVRSLAFQRSPFSNWSGIFKMDLPNLSELDIASIETEIFGETNVTWKIRKLQLQLKFLRFTEMLTIHHMRTDGLAVFGDSLEDLKLEFGSRDVHLVGAQLKLPCLKSLYVQTNKWDTFEWEVLLAKLERLETLEIVGDVRDPTLKMSFCKKRCWLSMPQLRSVNLVAKKYRVETIVHQEERTVCSVFKLKRAGKATVKFSLIKIKVSDS